LPSQEISVIFLLFWSRVGLLQTLLCFSEIQRTLVISNPWALGPCSVDIVVREKISDNICKRAKIYSTPSFDLKWLILQQTGISHFWRYLETTESRFCCIQVIVNGWINANGIISNTRGIGRTRSPRIVHDNWVVLNKEIVLIPNVAFSTWIIHPSAPFMDSLHLSKVGHHLRAQTSERYH
jgi:hypothetical protein